MEAEDDDFGLDLASSLAPTMVTFNAQVIAGDVGQVLKNVTQSILSVNGTLETAEKVCWNVIVAICIFIVFQIMFIIRQLKWKLEKDKFVEEFKLDVRRRQRAARKRQVFRIQNVEKLPLIDDPEFSEQNCEYPKIERFK